jgi:chitinase
MAAPVVTLSSPTSGSSYAAPAVISFSASVITNGYSLNGVNFFNDSTLLGSASSAPYTYIWSNVPAGTYSLSAQALYDAGSLVNSSPIIVTVTNPAAALPVTIYEPFNYNAGMALDGQGAWYLSGTASMGTIEAGNLTVAGLAPPIGNRYTWPVGNNSAPAF